MVFYQPQAIEFYGPPPATPEEALTHALGAHSDSPDDKMILLATAGIYGDGIKTGLTLGDLRAIQLRLEGRLF